MKFGTIVGNRKTLLLFWTMFVGLQAFLGCPAAIFAQEETVGRIIEMLLRKGVLDPQEAHQLGQTLGEDRRRLEQKEKALKEKEAALRQWEDRLAKREHRLEGGGRPDLQSSAKPERASTEETSSPPAPTGGEEARKDDQAGADRSFGWIRTDGLSLSPGGLLQTDYRMFDYPGMEANRDRFDIRRARLSVGGKASDRFDYYFLCEFQGAGSRRLLDAYVDWSLFSDLALRAGQLKEPFGLEQTSSDKNLFFAERSMGFFLTPGRDVGVMGHGSLWDGILRYALGAFTGDGFDDATGGDGDEAEWAGRLVFSPFRSRGIPALETLQFGGSAGFARVDRTNVDVHVKTAGLTSFFDVSSMAKFNVIRDVDRRIRYGAEFGWTFGPLLIAGEYVRLAFDEIATSSERFDTEMEDRYIALLWMLTGEKPELRDGKLQAVMPSRPLGRGGWGGLGLAFRYDAFEADESAYDNLIQEGVSVREARAYSIALNWYLDAWSQIILDATRTDFDRPLLIKRDSLTGVSLFSDREDVLTARYQFRF